MITCERCNTENLDGSQYCDECGALLGSAQQFRSPPTGAAENGSSPVSGAFDAEQQQQRRGGASATQAHFEMPMSPADNGHSDGRPPRQAPAPSYAVSSGEAAAAQAHTPHAKLVIHRGRSVGKEFPISEDETHIGRWDADGGIFPDVDLDSDDLEAKVSRRHARITRRGEQYFIEDLGSTNGTFINRGRRLLPGDRQPLRDGDEVIVGKTFLRFHVIK
ncbi:MAG TPA: FHA domain-containing protein [Pyrinomonadaceae bacterium]|jgi:hypothetical protein